MKRKVAGLEGRGTLLVEGHEDLPVYYSIAVWKEPLRPITHGDGRVWADAKALAARTPSADARLRIRGGGEVIISLSSNAGQGFAHFITESDVPAYDVPEAAAKPG